MKIDTGMLITNPKAAGPTASTLEAQGFDGVFTFEGQNDPFLPLAVAADHTSTIDLYTGIAVAFARNPMVLANIGYDLNNMSEGRFILGLGSQIKPHIERRFSAQWSKPAARMGELVSAIRAIWDCWQNGSDLNFRGEFYTHTLMTPMFNPGPCEFGLPKIFIAGFGHKMTSTAAEVGDGFLVHPLHTPGFFKDHTLPAIKEGLDKGQKALDNFEVSTQVIIASGTTTESVENAKVAARTQIAFYGSTPAYRPFMDHHGCGDLQPELLKLSKQGEWTAMSDLISEELLHDIGCVGTPEEVAKQLKERCGDWADRVSPSAYIPDPEVFERLVKEFKRV